MDEKGTASETPELKIFQTSEVFQCYGDCLQRKDLSSVKMDAWKNGDSWCCHFLSS